MLVNETQYRILYSAKPTIGLYNIQHEYKTYIYLLVSVCSWGEEMTYISQQAWNTGTPGLGVVVIYQYGGNPLISPVLGSRCYCPCDTRINRGS